MANDQFLNKETVNIFTALDGGGMESAEGFVVQAEENKVRVIMRSGLHEYMTFMYSTPDDMWLRVVPDGRSVACTRLEKIVPAMKDNTKKPVEPPKRDNSVWQFLKKK